MKPANSMIVVPKGFVHHGTLPDGTDLFSNHRYSVAITLRADGATTLISVNRRSINKTKLEEAEKVVREFGVSEFSRMIPAHRSNAIYFIVPNTLSVPKFEDNQ